MIPDRRWQQPQAVPASDWAQSGCPSRPRVTSQRWAPRYGFDHVMLTLFLELPNRSDGQFAMPLQFGNLPDGMRWHLRARLGGWSQALFSSKDSSNEREGTAVLADLAIEAGIWKSQGGRIEVHDGRKVFGKNIANNPNDFFTEDILKQLDTFCKKKYNYGAEVVEETFDEEEVVNED